MRYESGHISEIAGYRLTERLGSGGMGDVYKAYNEALNRTAAVKILHQKEMGDRFRNEAYIQSSVTHPNIARLYEYLVTGETACIIMEYVEGDPLDVYLHRKGKLSSEETEHIIKQIAAALAYLHSRDILHRDIKPQNFKVRSNGTVTMLDFGIAKNKYTPKLTQQGYMVGTTEYMAPEQFKQQVELKSDIWALGVLAYELVTGHMPFEANNAVSMRAKIEKADFTKPRILVPAVSDKMNTIIEKCLQTNPTNRFSASQVELLLSGKKPEQSGAKIKVEREPIKIKLPFEFDKKTIIVVAAFLLFFVIMLAWPDSKDSEDFKPVGEQTEQTMQRLTIDVPNAANAFIVFPDGSKKQLPYDITGKEGENFQFTLEADGYVPKKIEVPISVSRKSYDYNLEKIKE